MKIIKYPFFILIAIYILQVVVFYAPYIIKNRFDVIERNWDGPAYIVIAKTLYNPVLIKKENYIRKYLPEVKKFANKLPLYPILIRLFSFMGYEKSMLFNSLFFGLASVLASFYLFKMLKIKKAFLLSLLFIFYPPRWFVMQKVGGVETTFIFFIILSLIFFYKNKFFFSAVFLTLATLTKINGLLVFFSYILIFIFIKKNNRRQICYYFLSPLSIFLVFSFFQRTFGDFWIYFKSDSRCFEYVSLFKFPYSVFDASACYVGSIHLEEMFWFFGTSYLAIIFLLRKKQSEILAFFLPSFVPMLFLQHNDFTRHGIVLYLLFFIIFAKLLVKKELVIIFALLIPAVFLYARNFVNVNIFIP